MRFSESLKQNRDFKRLYARGKSAASPLLVVYCRRNGSDRNRLGLTVGTKVGKAVHRNRIRRRLREIYRLHEPSLRRGFDIIIVARVRARGAAYGELEGDCVRLFASLGLVKDESA
ncbi:MAG: ribonuclease P protein component [Oscillospiraceae bacterium]|nr:ribonuclease P protein component [Oscillospiraceae bacterium]